MITQMRTEPGTKIHFFLDARVRSPRVQEFDEKLAARIIGQENAVGGISSLYQLFLAGLNQTNRPVGTLLFLGPTGSGETPVVETATQGLFCYAKAGIQI